MTKHELIIGNSNNMSSIDDKSINLIVTSPPYPMIEMWDDLFTSFDKTIPQDLESGNGYAAFLKMHTILNSVWGECDRVLKDNGFVCINIGDATRTLNNNFQLFSNHTQIINFFLNKGYSVLPDILWRKPSNSPNKFMGSGMYPAGAYVTYEHEYILIFRKGSKRSFKDSEKLLRQKSAYFWEERNSWFSDLWEIQGTSQLANMPKSSRERNASFPFEIPYRLVNMYSVEGDAVLDPFAGLATTNLACMVSNRNSIGIEIDSQIATAAMKNITISPESINAIINERIQKHLRFINSLDEEKRSRCYINSLHNFLVKTKQETSIKIDRISSIITEDNTLYCNYI